MTSKPCFMTEERLAEIESEHIERYDSLLRRIKEAYERIKTDEFEYRPEDITGVNAHKGWVLDVFTDHIPELEAQDDTD